jgi:spermidine synthase
MRPQICCLTTFRSSPARSKSPTSCRRLDETSGYAFETRTSLKHTKHIPTDLIEGGRFAATTSDFDGRWFTQEDFGAVRMGLRTEAKLHDETSAYQRIEIYETTFFGRVLTIDGVVMLTERDEFVYHEMISHLPLCTMPEPRDVLIIGGGDCGALREVLRHPGIERAVQCEIDERVTRVCEDYFPWVAETAADPRAELIFADGVRYIKDHERSFDLIVIDSTDPTEGTIELFLREFYETAARALKPGGVLAAQAETPFWAPSMVREIYRQLRGAFRHATGYLSWIPTYSSGCWNLAYASNDREWNDCFARDRAEQVARTCRYYNPEVHAAAFALPNFAREVIGGGRNPFAAIEERARALAPSKE